jgi:hypothetical protein
VKKISEERRRELEREVKFYLRLHPDLHREVMAWAKAEHRSLHMQIVAALELGISAWKLQQRRMYEVLGERKATSTSVRALRNIALGDNQTSSNELDLAKEEQGAKEQDAREQGAEGQGVAKGQKRSVAHRGTPYREE